MTYTIQHAGSGDWAAVREVRLRSLQAAPAAYGSSYAREVALSDQDWQQRVATAHTFLAWSADSAVVGTVSGVGMRDGDVGLAGMYVDPAARGTGLAHAMIDEVVALTARSAGLRVVLRVFPGNEAAERCYRRYGFAPTGRVVTGESASHQTDHEYAYVLTEAVSVAADD